ncbi:MAG: hypothetical protein R3B48_20875 [Kofleriaceae bacterium]
MKEVTAITLLVGALLALGARDARAQQAGYWDCRRSYGAFTTERKMLGDTKFECLGSAFGGPGICGDKSHGSPGTWVDIVGGISQTCDDHSDSFYGYFTDGDSAPIGPGGEWNGCTIRYGAPYTTSPQVSYGARGIAGINQGWDRWPDAWWSGYYMISGCPQANWSSAMRGPFASIYDLDTCSFKSIVGTIYWPNFQVSSQLAQQYDCDGSYGYVSYDLIGDTGTSCSSPANWCESTVCADLHIRGRFECFFVPTGCDYYNPYGC